MTAEIGTFEQRIIAERYRVEGLLGRGSMGSVYHARHILTGGEVALKLISPDPTNRELIEARFRREVSISAHVDHEGIVRVHDAGREADGSLFLAMECLRGETFLSRSQRPGFTAAYGLNVVRALLEPLAAAHRAGIVHRDIKPENVFLHLRADGREQVKLLDFGIARDPRHPSGTRTDVGLGTPYYMSPEQATNARAVDARADVWAVGVILYWLLAGKLPFESDTAFNTLTLVCTTPAPPLPAAGGQTTAALQTIVARCLDKDPDRRPADAAALLSALEGALGPLDPEQSWGRVRYGSNPNLDVEWAPPAPAGSSGEAIVAPPTPITESPMTSLSVATPPPVMVRSDRHPMLRLGLVLLLLLFVGSAMAWWGLTTPHEAPLRAEPAPPLRAEPATVRSPPTAAPSPRSPKAPAPAADVDTPEPALVAPTPAKIEAPPAPRRPRRPTTARRPSRRAVSRAPAPRAVAEPEPGPEPAAAAAEPDDATSPASPERPEPMPESMPTAEAAPEVPPPVAAAAARDAGVAARPDAGVAQRAEPATPPAAPETPPPAPTEEDDVEPFLTF